VIAQTQLLANTHVCEATFMKSNLTVIAIVFGLALLMPTSLAVASDQSSSPEDRSTEGHGKDATGHLTENSHAEPKKAKSINPLSPEHMQAETAIWTGVLFLVLLAVLWKFAWGPLAAGLDKRESMIAGQIQQAEQANLDAKEMLGQYEQKLSDAKGEVRDIIDQGRRDAESVGQEMLDKAKQEAKAEQEKALREIDAATTDALTGLAAKSADLAVSLAGKIVDSQLDPTAHAKMIERAVSDFSTQRPK
jgi:F-type H+-transporting ATPase subunit b